MTGRVNLLRVPAKTATYVRTTERTMVAVVGNIVCTVVAVALFAATIRGRRP